MRTRDKLLLGEIITLGVIGLNALATLYGWR